MENIRRERALKKEEEKADEMALGGPANQAAPPQEEISDGQVKLKRRF